VVSAGGVHSGATSRDHDTDAPRDSATLILLRAVPGASGAFEVCLLQRPRSMAFAAGQYVFPGGTLEPGDREDAGAAWSGPAPHPWTESTASSPGLVVAAVRAAVRETFEEVGVLFAGTGADDVLAEVSGEEWEADRRAVAAGDVGFGQILLRRSLVLRGDLVRPWSRWVTPRLGGRRFDTRFCVALLPEGQQARAADGETEQLQWMTPSAAVESWRRGDLAMMVPTVETLRGLSEYTHLSEVFAADGSMDPIEPELRTIEGRRVLVTPNGTEYPLPPLRGRQ
jgi:8-oxo-dGTP pyrophosphatase MutT (NUDIX family)